jgi:hypothetical protein
MDRQMEKQDKVKIRVDPPTKEKEGSFCKV